MANIRLFTLRQIVELTKSKRRSVQLWADAGVLQAISGTERAGSGVHRQFTLEEAEIAALVAPLARSGVSIGNLQEFASQFRRLSRTGFRSRKAKKWGWDAIHRARKGEGANFLIYWGSEQTPASIEFVESEEGADITFCPPPGIKGAYLISLNEVWKHLYD